MSPTFEETEILPEVLLPVGGYDTVPDASNLFDLESMELGEGWMDRFNNVLDRAPSFGDVVGTLSSLADAARRQALARFLNAVEIGYEWTRNDFDQSLGDLIVEMLGDVIDVLNPIGIDPVADGTLPDWIEEIYPQPPEGGGGGGGGGGGSDGGRVGPIVPTGCSVTIYREGVVTQSGRGCGWIAKADGSGYFRGPIDASRSDDQGRRRIVSYRFRSDLHEEFVETQSARNGTDRSGWESTAQYWGWRSRRTGRNIFRTIISSAGSTWSQCGGERVQIDSVGTYSFDVIPRAGQEDRCEWPERDEPAIDPPRNDDPGDDDGMSCNCRDMEAMLRKLLRNTTKNLELDSETQDVVYDISEITGVAHSELPGELPGLKATATGEARSEYEVRSLVEMIKTMYEQFDSVIGLFPANLTVKAPVGGAFNVSNAGYESIAEMLLDMLVMQHQIAAQTEANFSATLRCGSEAIKAKIAATVGQSYSKANAGFLGYRGNLVNQALVNAFDFSDSAAATILGGSVASIPVWRSEDTETVAGYLSQIQVAVEIVRGLKAESPSSLRAAIQLVSQAVDGDVGESLDELIAAIGNGSWKTTPPDSTPEARDATAEYRSEEGQRQGQEGDD